MTNEDKNLLLKDLCGRLPYHVRIKVWLKDGTTEEGFFDFEHNYDDVIKNFFFYDELKDLKPYLRKMPSMDSEEYLDYDCNKGPDIDWLNSHHIDYRGLIEKGLAYEAPEGMYNIL